MVKVERFTYANTIILTRDEYSMVHGIIEHYGGRIKDCQYNWDNNDMIMYYEMAKDQRKEFELELYNELKEV